jgi:glyceraldehyde 3-phosphate dehydrogenase
MNVAINGFGRIGRNFLRCVLSDPQAAKNIEIVAINIGHANRDFTAHMFKYDTIMGTYAGTVEMRGDSLVVDGRSIKIIAVTDPMQAGWKQLQVDWVVDATGAFTHREKAEMHLKAGARGVLITAPAHGEDITIVPGVNEELFDSKKHTIVSLGSCTTNAFATMARVLNDAFTIKQGCMTTVHAYTNTQVLLDVETDDLRRSRAAALNIIPTSSGASSVVGKIIPSLANAIIVHAVRVPVATVSLIDFSFVAEKALSVDAVHAALRTAATQRMKGIIGFTQEPLVSSDFKGSNYSVVIDGLLTAAQGSMGKVFGWYDNEWGYSERLKDFLLYVDSERD